MIINKVKNTNNWLKNLDNSCPKFLVFLLIQMYLNIYIN